MENDLTANLKGTMMTDHNGETAALIKVVTSEQGFTFDGGMVGIVKTKQEAGEVWVWVPHGIKKMSVRHPQLGVLRDYYFPISIEKARTYEMVLTTGKVQTLVNHSIKKQFVIFNVTPANATIEFNGENLSVDASGYAETSVPFGRYNYRVMHPDYHTSAGVADVLEGGSKVVINANLTPNFGYLDIVASEEYNGASVYVNGVQRGELPLQKIQLRSATYVVRIEKDLYKPYEQSIEVKDGETNHWVLPAMEANFAMIELLSQPKAEIWLNGELKGVEKWTGPLSVGEYRVETKQISHVPATETIRIMDTTARSIQLKLPTPLYSSMEITSSPSRAKVYIDGVDMGETPLILNEVLIGMRDVVLEKEGFERQVRNVQVDYGVSASLKVDMTAPQAEEPIEEVAQPAPEDLAQKQNVTPSSEVPAPSSFVSKRELKKQAAAAEKLAKEQEEAAKYAAKMAEKEEKERRKNIEGGDVTIKAKHIDEYKLYVNGEQKATFKGDKYHIGYLENDGVYRFKLKGIKHSGSLWHKIEEPVKTLKLRTWTSNTYYHTNFSMYAGAGCAQTILGAGGVLRDYRLSAVVGAYWKCLNAEYNYNYQLGSDRQAYDLRLGYGLKMGRAVMLTPQIGYGAVAGFDYLESDYSKLSESLLLAARLQLCVSKSISLAVTPVYSMGMNTLEINTSLLFNVPFGK